MKRNITLSVLLISLLAVGVYAQTESDPAKEQIQEQIRNEENLQNQEQLQNQDETRNQEQINNQEQIQEENQLQNRKNNEVLEGDKSLDGEPLKDQTRQIGSENAQNPGTGDANQNYIDREEGKPGEPYADSIGPNGETGHQGDKTLSGDKDGDQTRELNYGDGDGDNHELGDNNRRGDDYTGDGGQKGPMDHGDKALDGECDGDQTQNRNYGEGDGDNHELGEIHRNGDENTGVGGPHGPLGSGTTDDFFKAFGEDASGTMSGDMLQYRWGPGDSTLDGPFGPNSGNGGYGPGGRDAADGEEPTKSTRGQARAGRR